MAHQPNHAHEVAKAANGRETLMLSGHTHGGQIFPLTIIVHFFNVFVQGLNRYNENFQVLVSRGTGQWGPKLRLFSRAEIINVKLSG